MRAVPMLTVFAIFCVVVVAVDTDAVGEIVRYNVSAFSPDDPTSDEAAQTAYLDAVCAGGYSTFFEGFSGSAWDTARSSIGGGAHLF